MFDSHHLPRTVYVTTNEEKISSKWYDGSDSISSNVLLATVKDIEQADKTIIFPKHYSPGDILILHPFDESRYVSLSRLEDLENSKFVRFTEIAQLLGATRYTIFAGTKKTYNQTLSVNGKLNVPTKAEVKLNLENKEDFKEQMGFELTDRFKGMYVAGSYDYKKALDLVQQYNFEDEESLLSLVKTRNPQNSNVHFSRTVVCNVTQELNEALDIALSLTACKAFNFDSTVKKKLESRIEKRVEINFTFPESEL